MKDRSWCDKKKKGVLLCQNGDTSFTKINNAFSHSRKVHVYRGENVSNTVLMVGKAYNEPQVLSSNHVENILLQRDYIID